MRELRGIVFLAALAAAVVVPMSASASPGWVPSPTTLSDPSGFPNSNTGSDLQVASDAKGDTVAVFDDYLSNVWESERLAGGSWSTPAEITQVSTETPQQLQPTSSLYIDSSGLIYVFFLGGDASHSHAAVATKQLGGSTWTVTDIANHQNAAGPFSPVVGAVSPSGQAVAVWSITDDPNAGAQTAAWWYATKPAGSTTWTASPGTALCPSGCGQYSYGPPELVMDAAGDATFTYAYDAIGSDSAEVTTLPSGQANWSSPVPLSGAAITGQPVEAIDSSGTSTIAWLQGGVVYFSTKTLSGGSWSSATALSPGSSANPAIAIQPDGTTTVGWTTSNTISERTRAAGASSFAAATTIPSSDTSPTGLRLVAGGDNSMVALWSGMNATPVAVISGARRAAGVSSFTAIPDAPGTANAPSSGQTVAAATDSGGDVGAAWINATNSPQVVQADGLVVAPPTIGTVTFPSTAVRGTAFPYSAAITPNPWTTATGSWNFGNGSTASNTSGTFTYLAAGQFTAVFSATDPFGNMATKSFPITVATPSTGGTGGTGGAGGTGGTGGTGGKKVAPAKPALHHRLNRKKHKATFTFSDSGQTGFECALIKLPASHKGKKHKKAPVPRFGACPSPKSYSKLKGSYEFFVFAVNSAGKSPEATFTFKV